MRFIFLFFLFGLILTTLFIIKDDNFSNLIKQYLPFQAAVIKTLPSESQVENLDEESEEEIISPKEENEDEEFTKEAVTQGPDANLVKIQNDIDNIAEKIDILDQEMSLLMEEAQVVSEEEPEEITEEDTEEPEEELEKEEKNEEKEPEVGQDIGQNLCEVRLGDNSLLSSVILNEIVWMGSGSSANDEWIELKNISNSPVNLENWQIIDKEKQIRIIFTNRGRTSVELSAGGFYLLERTDDNSVPNIIADLIYTGVLNDTDEFLYLFNEYCQLEDKAEANPNWPAGDKTERRSMERKPDFNPEGIPSGSYGAGWQSYYGDSQNGILGTPKRENSLSPAPETGGGGGSSQPTPAEPVVCSQENLSEPAYSPVIFNEIAWMGTENYWGDEWLELKNVSENDISLDGWQILDKDEEIKIIFNTGGRASLKLPAGGFYLLERTNDNSVPNLPADKIYSGNLEDNNESLRLFDKNCNLIDEVLAGPDWPAGQKEERKSMERKHDFDWQTYSGEGEEGIMGTPKKENSLAPEPKDETPPSIVFDIILPLQLNPEFIISWSGEDPQDGIIPSGIDGFLLRYSEDKESWNYFPSEEEYTTETQYSFSGENEHTYYFQIKAKDKAGNESEWFEIIIEINTLPVVINEIAWMGTKTSFNDEWIELFNNTNSEINFNGWSLKAVDGTPDINLTGTIPAKEFYLLERTDDETLSDIPADQIYTGALGNAGEKLELYALDYHLVDRVICKEGQEGDCKEWFAGNNDTKQTMERKNPRLPGDINENWGTSQEEGGTPKSQNSQ